MLHLVQPPPTDFWGIVIPTWLAAVGTVAASVIAVVGLFRSQSAARGVQELAQGANQTPTPARELHVHIDDNLGLTDEVEPPGNSDPTIGRRWNKGEATGYAPIVWAVANVGRSKRSLQNTSTRTAQLLEFTQVDGGDDVSFPVELPAAVGPGVVVPFTVDRSLASPAVIAVTIRWTDDALADEQTRTLYV